MMPPPTPLELPTRVVEAQFDGDASVKEEWSCCKLWVMHMPTFYLNDFEPLTGAWEAIGLKEDLPVYRTTGDNEHEVFYMSFCNGKWVCTPNAPYDEDDEHAMSVVMYADARDLHHPPVSGWTFANETKPVHGIRFAPLKGLNSKAPPPPPPKPPPYTPAAKGKHATARSSYEEDEQHEQPAPPPPKKARTGKGGYSAQHADGNKEKRGGWFDKAQSLSLLCLREDWHEAEKMRKTLPCGKWFGKTMEMAKAVGEDDWRKAWDLAKENYVGPEYIKGVNA